MAALLYKYFGSPELWEKLCTQIWPVEKTISMFVFET